MELNSKIVCPSKSKNFNLNKQLKVNGKLCEDLGIITQQFNQYFNSIPGKLHQKVTKLSGTDNSKFMSYMRKSVCSSIRKKVPTPTELYNLIQGLPIKKSPGLGGITPFFLKTVSIVLAPYLVVLFTRAINYGIFPQCLKLEKITPIHKNGSTYKVSNFRLTSLLSCLGKVFEKVGEFTADCLFFSINTLLFMTFNLGSGQNTLPTML